MGHNFGVLVFKDAYRGEILWCKFLDKKETRVNYMESVERLDEHRFHIRGLVCDGLKGLPQMLARYKVQLCHFHQVKSIKHYLTSRLKTPAGIELKAISMLLCRTDKESFQGALERWHTRWGEYIKERSVDSVSGKRYYTYKRVLECLFQHETQHEMALDFL